MGQLSVIYDACVLYSAPLRSFLMYLAMTDLYRARWTDAIHDEWMRSVLRDFPDIDRKKVERIRDLMNQHVFDPLVRGFESRIEGLQLPDPNDRHVLAAAIHSNSRVIVTFNTRHFPESALKPLGIKALHPDDFVVQFMGESREIVCQAARQQRLSLKNPPLSVEEYLAALDRQGLSNVVHRLRQFADVI